MAFTQLQLDTLNAAIASGTLEVRYGDKVHKYQSTSDMLRARDVMQAELAKDAGQMRTSLASFSKG